MHKSSANNKTDERSRPVAALVLTILVALQLVTKPNECQLTAKLQTQTTASVAKLNESLLIRSKVDQSASKPPTSATTSQSNNKTKATPACDYDKSKWTECDQSGVQERTLTLRSGGRSEFAANKCEQIKTIRRDCKPVGCKYLRGDWSAQCVAGKRTRVDTLVGALGKAANCKRERRVTKDCRRACHYFKSAWSECINGVRTRNLTLDESTPTDLAADQQGDGGGGQLERPAATRRDRSALVVSMAPAGQHCASQKLVKRDCRPPSLTVGQKRKQKQQLQRGTTKQVSTAATTWSTTAPNTSNGRRR